MKLLVALLILLPLFGSLFQILLGRLVARRLAEAVSCAVIWAAFGVALALAARYQGPITAAYGSWLTAFTFHAPFTLVLDPLALSLCLMITLVCGLIHLYSIGYMQDDPGYLRYFALLNLFVAAMLLLVLAGNLPLLYLGWEGVGFCSYALIGFWYKEEANADAGRKAFIVTRIGDVGLALALIWMFFAFGTVSIGQLNQMGTNAAPGLLTALGLLLLLAAMGKSAQVPLMVWLPDAMAGPTPVSAQIHAATMVTAGVYLLMRMFPLIGLSPTVAAAIACTGGLTALFGATCALAQRDLKRILAYSTISQIGYMLLAVGAGAITSATFHLIEHALFKALLFLAAGCVITALHHQQDIFRMGDLRRAMPATFLCFLAGAICLAGLPLTGGFFSKDGVLAAAWLKGGPLFISLYWLGLATAFLTAVYTFRMVLLVFGCSGERIPPSPASPAAGNGGLLPVPAVMRWPLWPLAMLALLGGLLNLPAYLGQGSLARLLAPLEPPVSGHLSHTAELLLATLAGLISLAGLALAWLRYGPSQRRARLAEAAEPPQGLQAFLLHGWYVDALYRRFLVRPYARIAALLWERVDEGLIDDSLDHLANRTGQWGRALGELSCGRVSVYLLSLSAGAALCLGWFAWVSL